MTFRTHPTRRTFGFREVFGFGRTDMVVRPGRTVVMFGQVCTVTEVFATTCFVQGATAEAVVMVDAVRGTREVSR